LGAIWSWTTGRPGWPTRSRRPGRPVPYVGIGAKAAAAWAPYLTTIKGVTIAIIGVSQVAELASSWVATGTRPGEANAIDLGRTLAAVRSARRQASVVIVFMHWGTEGQACPDPAQLSLARELAAAGASIKSAQPGLRRQAGVSRSTPGTLWLL
jgi:hypothetical protein